MFLKDKGSLILTGYNVVRTSACSCSASHVHQLWSTYARLSLSLWLGHNVRSRVALHASVAADSTQSQELSRAQGREGGRHLRVGSLMSKGTEGKAFAYLRWHSNW